MKKKTVEEDVLPLPGSTFQSPQTQGTHHLVSCLFSSSSTYAHIHAMPHELIEPCPITLNFRPTLLSEYGYALEPNGLLYTITDVHDLHLWMVKHLTSHPLFKPISEDDLISSDESEKSVIQSIRQSTEEGKKVARNHGEKFLAVFRRISLEEEQSKAL